MSPTFKNDLHDLVIDESTAVDFHGSALSKYLNDLVNGWQTPASVWDDINTVAEHGHTACWSGVAVMMGTDTAGVDTARRLVDPTAEVGDYPDYEHVCTWLVDLSNARALREILLNLEDKTEEDNTNACEGDGWLFWENRLWFDPENAGVRNVIEAYEIALNDCSIINDERHSEIEREHLEIVADIEWSALQRHCDDTVSEEDVFDVFRENNSTGCERCGLSMSMENAIKENHGQCACGDYTANIDDDGNEDGEPECESCREEREAEEDVDEVDEDE